MVMSVQWTKMDKNGQIWTNGVQKSATNRINTLHNFCPSGNKKMPEIVDF